MSTYNDGTLLGKLITWFFVALLAIAAIKLAFWMIGIAFGVAGFLLALLFRVGPILLIGWLAVKMFRALRRRPEYPIV